MSALDKILAQYKKDREEAVTTSNSYSPNNYFSPRLGNNQTSGSVTIRILPELDGQDSAFDSYYGHYLSTNTGKPKDSRLFACLEHEEKEECPACEARKMLYASGTDDDKEAAKKLFPKKHYVIRVIDRDNEDHGVKFWRFAFDKRGIGYMDRFNDFFGAIGLDPVDPDNGYDIKLTLNKNEKGDTVVTNFIAKPPSPLSTDSDKAKKWLSDTRTWRDVFSVKPKDYIELLIMGKQPVWSKEKECYVAKEVEGSDDDSSTSEAEEAKNELEMSLKKGDAKSELVTSEPIEDDDLPF